MNRPSFLKKILSIFCITFLALLSFPENSRCEVLTEPGIRIAILPIVNDTDIEIWENKYYPQDVFTEKLQKEFITLLREYPYSTSIPLNDAEESRWFRGEGPIVDIGIKLHFYKLKTTDRKHLGTDRMGYVAMRMEIYSGFDRKLAYATSLAGEDRRFTFAPGDGRIFYLSNQPESGHFLFLRPLDFIPVNKMFPRGLDFWQLFQQKDDDQPLSRPLWKSFKRTPYWNAFKKVLRKSRDSLFSGLGGYKMVGRIISPTKSSLMKKPPKRRQYIISLGMVEGVRKGDLLKVMRSDRYDTVDPERPVVIIPENAGLVKVILVKQHEAVIEVVKENKKEPIHLKDLVVMPLQLKHR